MAVVCTKEADALRADYIAIQETMRRSITAGYAGAKATHWDIWIRFCASIGEIPCLSSIRDPVPYIQIFGHRYRDGRLSASGNPVGSKTVSDAMRSVGQTLRWMGSKDVRLDEYGEIDFRIRAQIKAYKKVDPAPNRVKPAPITLVIDALNFAYHEKPTAERKAVANMICLAFFFCLRPGEYTGTTTDDQAFAVDDVVLFLGGRRLNNATATDDEVAMATHVHLIFTTQKNGEKGEEIAHARSGDPLCCPVTSVSRQLILHREESRRRGTPYDGAIKLATYYNLHNTRVPVKASHITQTLRWHAGVLEPVTGIPAASISARSLRAGGAMALLAGGCDKNIIQLLARWKSDAMMRYLHQQARPVFEKLAGCMFNNGQYTFLPTDWVPAAGATVIG